MAKFLVTYSYEVTYQREVDAISISDAHNVLHEMDTNERMSAQYEIGMEMLDTVEVEEVA